MGPASFNFSSCPRLSWDICSTAWTDGKGNNVGVATTIEIWKKCPKKLPATIFNRIAAGLSGTCLKSQPYGPALDLTRGILDDHITSDGGLAALLEAVYKRDTLFVANDVYHDFTDILAICQSDTKAFPNCETLFIAHAASLLTQETNASVYEYLLAMIILAEFQVDDSLRIPILSAAGH